MSFLVLGAVVIGGVGVVAGAIIFVLRRASAGSGSSRVPAASPSANRPMASPGASPATQKCPKCGLVNFAGATACRRCKAPIG